MSTELEKLQEIRFRILEYLYKKSEADTFHYIDWRALVGDLIASNLEFKEIEIRRSFDYLVGEYLAERKTMGSVGITHYGIKEYEDAIKHPDQETTYFPPLNILYVQHMEHSQIQQGNIQSSMSQSIVIENKNEIEQFIKLLKERQEELGLERRTETDLNADISTIEAQLKSSRPKTNILKESISSIKSILEGTAGSIIAVELLKYIPPILEKLG